jgi:enamine deaminase RidA (YjgF/YER057c/UK114 family)
MTGTNPPASPHRSLQPEGWVKPVGYANGVEARGRMVFVGGQIGWNAQCRFEVHDLPGQVRQALDNVVAVLREAGAGPEHLTTMTWYVLDRKAYSAALKEVGAAGLQHRHDILQRLPHLADKIVGLEAAFRVPADLSTHENGAAARGDAIGIADRPRPTFGLQEFKHRRPPE